MGKSSVRSRTPEKVPVDPPSFGRADKTNRESDNRTSILFHSLFMQTRASDILVLLTFHSDSYSPAVADILALDGRGARPMELFPRRCESETVRRQLLKADARELFPGARDPEAALSGLFLYFSCLKESHDLLHRFATIDGAYWHGIMHRMEGDGYNAAYWFHRVPAHPVYAPLARNAAQLGYGAGGEWDPFAFIRFCETSAREKQDDLAKRVQLAEWQLLFKYCATPAGNALRSVERAAAR